MEISIAKTIYEKVTLDEHQINSVAYKKLKRMLKGDRLQANSSDNGNLWVTEDIDNYHGSPSTKWLRPASDLDIALVTVIRALAQEKF